MTTVIFEQTGAGYTLRFNDSPTVVDLIKTTVPGYCRSWRPATKTWRVDHGWADALAGALRAEGHTVVGLDQPRDPRGECRHCRGEPDVTHWATLLFKRVGRHRADPVYRALSRCLHPDVGGDAAMQRELNDAHREQITNQERAS